MKGLFSTIQVAHQVEGDLVCSSSALLTGRNKSEQGAAFNRNRWPESSEFAEMAFESKRGDRYLKIILDRENSYRFTPPYSIIPANKRPRSASARSEYIPC